ncbi:HTH-type transcriptional activator RhaR [Paenibacillus sp. CECT 9249]|uniref:AraC family transcriptional regulator n=1 Tax=Paenibacillus sp. CECT 9249 TaxID=2845385 RepID=UPI001E590863|nr:AraC family transcriptional regulator [Paenibacillus sp. CECT 9249]CAH0120864.1 HTH-type transcriptional activator RhaR [Paenibacillus sp. CECT 9249]
MGIDLSLYSPVVRQFLSARMKNVEQSFVHPPLDYERELLEAIRLGDESKAMSTMNKINELEGATLAAEPIRSKKNALIASCTLFTRAIIKGGLDPETAFQLSDTFIQEIERIGTMERLAYFEYEMITQFIAVMKREQETLDYSHLVRLSIYYIREHIFQELSLERIAKHAYVHPSYLSDRFKKETGSTITAYINRRKIEESKNFLTHTNISISEIALLFKFCNQSYYSHLFKKCTGMTPKQFRKEASHAEP